MQEFQIVTPAYLTHPIGDVLNTVLAHQLSPAAQREIDVAIAEKRGAYRAIDPSYTAPDEALQPRFEGESTNGLRFFSPLERDRMLDHLDEALRHPERDAASNILRSNRASLQDAILATRAELEATVAANGDERTRELMRKFYRRTQGRMNEIANELFARYEETVFNGNLFALGLYVGHPEVVTWRTPQPRLERQAREIDAAYRLPPTEAP